MNIPNVEKDEELTIKSRIKYSKQQVIDIIKSMDGNINWCWIRCVNS